MNKSAATTSYKEFTSYLAKSNPSLSGLHSYLSRETCIPSKVTTLDFDKHGTTTRGPRVIKETNFGSLATAESRISTRIILIEDITPHTICALGEAFDIEPSFFASYITTYFENIENKPPPPSLGMLPSVISERGNLHIHYHEIMDLGSADALVSAPYGLQSDVNVARNVRRLPPLSGRQLALARTCCSVLVKKIGSLWICLFLIDPPIKALRSMEREGSQRKYTAKPLHGSFEDFGPAPSFSSFKLEGGDRSQSRQSILDGILRHFQAHPPGLTASQPTILTVGYYALRVSISEWMLYTLLISRYCKHYEYSLNDIETRLHSGEIIDLQRWRRRVEQSRQKLTVLTRFIKYWTKEEPMEEPWDLMLSDLQHIQRQLDHYRQSLDQMIMVAVSMVQLLDSRRSILEAVNVRRLTYIALVFVPLSWVSTLFSMSEAYSPGHERFWVYFATALPLLCFVLVSSALPYNRLPGMLRDFWGNISRRRQKMVSSA